jgi:MFS transporter, DHA1 family, staphyloferrin A biosynthesis exporter
MAGSARTGGSLRSMVAPLAHREFRWLWGGSLVSYAAQWLQQASLGWVVYELTGSGAMVGAVLGVRAIPMLVIAPLAGVAADRYERSRLLQGCQWFAAAVAFAFSAALAFNYVPIWVLFAFSLLMGSAVVLDRPARQSSLFELVPRDLAMKAIALNVMGNNLARVIAPAVSGLLIAWIGMAGNFLVESALCAAAALLVLRVNFRRREAPAQRVSASEQLAAGLRYAATDPTIRLLFLTGTSSFLLLVPATGTLFPIYAKDVYGTGPIGVGMMFTAIGVGGISGAYFAGVLARVDRQGLVQVAANLTFVVMMVGLALSPNFAMALVFCVFAGGAEMVLMTSNITMMQMAAPDAMRGRITSLALFYPAMISLGGLITGPLADVYGAAGATLIAAGACTLATLALFAGSARLRGLRLSEYK